jgi:hypothetical protein
VSKKGLKINILELIDVTTAAAWTLDVIQTPAQLKKDGAAVDMGKGYSQYKSESN